VELDNLEKTNDILQDTDKLYHLKLLYYIHLITGGSKTHKSGEGGEHHSCYCIVVIFTSAITIIASHH